jgi:UDP-glucose 4-epimerase
MTGSAMVTGGAGFIGSHLVDRLLAEGYRVVVLDDFSTGGPRNLDDVAGDPGLEVVHGSVLDADLVDSLVGRNSVVFHLAAAVGVRYIVNDPVGSVLTNVRGTENVLASCARHGARLVLASTSEIYGRNASVPFREDADRVLGPTWMHRWSYSTAKAIDEHLAFAYSDRGLAVSIVRFFNAYGPRIDENGYGSVVARFIAQALAGQPMTVHGDGRQTRCFTFVSDTVEGTLRAGTRLEALGKVFNVGAAEEISIMELAETIRRIVDSSSSIDLVPYESSYPRGFEDTRRRVPDVTRARDELGFAAAVPLRDGMTRTVAWCRANYAAASSRT